MGRFKRLVMVTADNHNKFYELSEKDDMTIARYGRVGQKGVTKTYPLYSFDEIYEKKIRKGYTDVTNLCEVVPSNGGYAPEKDKAVDALIQELMRYSNLAIKKEYTVSSDAVTPEMVKEAEIILDDLSYYVSCPNEYFINEKLLRLWEVIPRSMHHVNEMLYHEGDDFNKLLDRENDILDVLKARVIVPTKDAKGKSFLEQCRCDITKVTETKRLDEIAKHLDPHTRAFFHGEAFRVHNAKRDKAFEKCVKDNGYGRDDIHILYHGTRNRNVLGILKEGPIGNSKATRNGSMFGRAETYLAPLARKSLRYTSLDGYYTGEQVGTGFLFTCKAAYSNPKHVYTAQPNATKQNIAPHDAMYAHKGKVLFNDEIMVYERDRLTIQYLIKLSDR